MRKEGGKKGGRGQGEESWESRATALELVVSEKPCLNFLQPAPLTACTKLHAQGLLFVWTINSGKFVFLRVVFMGNRHFLLR